VVFEPLAGDFERGLPGRKSSFPVDGESRPRAPCRWADHDLHRPLRQL